MGDYSYQELAEFIRARLRDGLYPVGTTLPKQDDLAEFFDVNVNTIRRVVEILEQEGLVKAVQGKGTVVCALPARIAISEARDLRIVRIKAHNATQALRAAADWLDASTLDTDGYDIEHLRFIEPETGEGALLVIDLVHDTAVYRDADSPSPTTNGS